ncbi:flagellar hook-associated protein FlgK [Salipiger mucosus]|uniref:Flagellar hook-associated protein 1 n=1 Tax=Salipiger mucosus DSM 16094 TaxID=1123237 RepID=S9RVM3_9RHOB|nr:flagellar hook-associated protein FlgK [Salipiger mucosus]EPX78029.1 Flagellar hook-associated protein FlgK [Salipiger mucosus DSM 16094]
MSLTAALFSGSSGLRANQKWSETTARNISNANTEGYVRKDIQFSTRSPYGGGVHVSEISREVNESINRMYRLESAKMEREKTIYEGIDEYTAFLGQPNDEQSPASRLGDFEEDLVTLANNPGDTSVLGATLNSAKDMAYSIRSASETLGQVRNGIDQEIKYEVSDLNETLHKMTEMNQRILRQEPETLDWTETLDEMDRLIDSTAETLDIRAQRGPDGRVSIYTAGGAPLVEKDEVSRVTFNQGNGVLMAGNQEITPGAPGIRGFENGRLGGLMTLKQDVMPKFQRQLDEMAAGIIQSFEDNDPSRAAGDAGLFTDDGSAAAYNSANIDGLASRISVNAAVDPDQGGSLYRLRDGVGATSPGPSGDSSTIEGFIDGLNDPRSFSSATELPTDISIKSYANNLVAAQQTERTGAEKSYSVARTAAESIETSRLSKQGVNVDDELQKLILIEQSYAANSKIMTSVSDMMDRLINIV